MDYLDAMCHRRLYNMEKQNILCNDFFKEHGAHQDLMILE